MRYFVAIAEDEHFGRAAQRIRIAQPALSRQIQLLEAELGVTLFDRLARGVKLSAAGRTFLQHCRHILADLDHAVSETQAVARGESGVLKLGFIEVVAWSGVIPETIMQFRLANPGVRLQPNAMTSLDQIEAILEGRIDAGFLYNPPDDPLLTALPVTRHTLLLAVPAASDFATRSAVDISELAGQPLISFHRHQSPGYYDQLHREFLRAGLAASIVHEAENEAEMLALVTTGLGIALVNECQRWRKPHGLALIAVTGFDIALDLALVYRSGQPLPALERFIALLAR